jgi:hypothetical protein
MSRKVNGYGSKITVEWDHCDHLSIGDRCYAYYGEDDVCGPIYRYGMCRCCYKQHLTDTDRIEELLIVEQEELDDLMLEQEYTAYMAMTQTVQTEDEFLATVEPESDSELSVDD